MSRGMNRAQRLREMERLYLEHAYTDKEIAEVLGIRRETAYEDRVALETEDEIPFVEVEYGKRRIDRTRYLPNLRVNLHEALALYLAMRRASRQTRTGQPHVTRALEKLALILKQPMTERLIRAATLMAQQPKDQARVKVMEDLAQGWALHQKVRIHYDALTGSKEKVHTISPYLIEPSHWSDAIYVIAASNRLSKPTPFNVARITETFVTTETFELPEDFDEQELLRFAWGIWARESEPETVQLKFTGREAIKRMRETIWHPLQKEPVEAPDGWIWEAPVAEWKEMVPWVRGWGADVEVLEPRELREIIAVESVKLGRLYGWKELYSHSSSQDQSFQNQNTIIRSETGFEVHPKMGRQTMYYEEYLTCLAKTEPALTLFNHSSDVLQVAEYLIAQNASAVRKPDIIRAGALTHDVGKIKNDLRKGQWIHSPHSKIYLDPLLDDPRFQSLLAQANVNVAKLDRELLLMICEEHHNPSPKLLRLCKEAILVSVADAIASSIGSGNVGSITALLRSNPYMQINLELVQSLGFNKGLDHEVHHIDLPSQFTEDLFLADMIFRAMDETLRDSGVTPLVQKGASLWVVGKPDQIRAALAEFKVDPKQLYDSAFDERIFDSVLFQFPAGAMQIDILRFLLVNEPLARKMAIALYTRSKPKKLFEKYNLSHLIDKADELFAQSLGDGIDALWFVVRLKLLELAPELQLPITLAAEVELAAIGASRQDFALFAKPKTREDKSKKPRHLSTRAQHNCEVLDSLQDEQFAIDLAEFMKLFDCSMNSYRSLTNILLELIKIQADIENGEFSLSVSQVALIDGQPLEFRGPPANAKLCPICRRFRQEIKAPALITGRSEGDSLYYTSRQTREGAIKICRWCFVAGYMDLPVANVIREGNSIIKSREILVFTSPQSKDNLQRLVDFVRRSPSQSADEQGGEDEPTSLDENESKELEKMLGSANGYDELAVFGLSRRRLANIKGFVLPTVNILANMVCIRIPFERLVGEDKVSGAARRELVKATMYDLHLLTGATSMHYNIVTDVIFSVNGRPTTLEEMHRANTAYRIASRYARVGTYRQLRSGIFMLLLSNPRQAITAILRTVRRENHGQYVPSEDRIKEMIQMAESIAQKDWKFELGLRIVSTLVEVGLTPKARSFRYGPNPQDVFSGVELVKWIQRIKMIRDDTSARAWGNMLINALKRGDLVYKDYIKSQGGEIGAPGEEKISKILGLVVDIINICNEHKCKLSELSRDIADMDYYLLFYHNQQVKEAK